MSHSVGAVPRPTYESRSLCIAFVLGKRPSGCLERGPPRRSLLYIHTRSIVFLAIKYVLG